MNTKYFSYLTMDTFRASFLLASFILLSMFLVLFSPTPGSAQPPKESPQNDAFQMQEGQSLYSRSEHSKDNTSYRDSDDRYDGTDDRYGRYNERPKDYQSTFNNSDSSLDKGSNDSGLQIYTNEQGDNVMRTTPPPRNEYNDQQNGNTYYISPEIYPRPHFNPERPWTGNPSPHAPNP